jgi:hypothetical protein
VPRISGSSTVEGVLVDWSLDQPVSVPALPVQLLSKEQVATELQRRQRRRAMEAAYEAELILRMAELTSDENDPPAGTPGARTPGWATTDDRPGVSEFFPGELALVLNRGRGTATHLHARARAWRDNLPTTYRDLTRGELDEARATALADVLGNVEPDLAGAIEAELLPEANDLSVARLRARAQELLLALDAEAADARRKETRKSADVFLQPGADGMATLGAELAADEAAEAYATIDRLARLAKADGDERPIAQLRTELFSLLLRRPGGHGQPDVTTHLTITATLAALSGATTDAGSVDGLAITAAHVRELLSRIGALGLQTPPAGSLTFALTDADGRLLATTTVAELLRTARNGCRAHPGSTCDCPVLGPPAATDRYAHTDRQERYVATRDGTCRMPNCGQRIGWTDLDHVVPHAAGGRTTCTNLCCLCRSHHRLKTFARGWDFRMEPDGTLHVTTPSGVTRTTRPPGSRTASEPSPDRPPTGSPPTETDGDPPPF